MPNQLALLRLWVTQHKHGLSLRKLRWVQILCSLGLAEPSLHQYHESANVEYTPLHEVVYPTQGGDQMGMVPNEGASDLSAPERLRRLAGCYVSNPDTAVNGVYVEPGPSGRFQVVITIDICDVLGETGAS